MKKELFVASLIASMSIGMSACNSKYTPESAAEEICEIMKDGDLKGLKEHVGPRFLALTDNEQEAAAKKAEDMVSECSDVVVEVKDLENNYYALKGKGIKHTIRFTLDTKKNTFRIEN